MLNVEEFVRKTGREKFYNQFLKAGYSIEMLSDYKSWETWNKTIEDAIDIDTAKYIAFLMLYRKATPILLDACRCEKDFRELKSKVQDFFLPSGVEGLSRFKTIGGNKLVAWWFKLFIDFYWYPDNVNMLVDFSYDFRDLDSDSVKNLLTLGVDLDSLLEWIYYTEGVGVLNFGKIFLEAGLNYNRLREIFDEYLDDFIYNYDLDIQEITGFGIKLTPEDAQYILNEAPFEETLPQYKILKELGADLEKTVIKDIREGLEDNLRKYFSDELAKLDIDLDHCVREAIKET